MTDFFNWILGWPEWLKWIFICIAVLGPAAIGMFVGVLCSFTGERK